MACDLFSSCWAWVVRLCLVSEARFVVGGSGAHRPVQEGIAGPVWRGFVTVGLDGLLTDRFKVVVVGGVMAGRAGCAEGLHGAQLPSMWEWGRRVPDSMAGFFLFGCPCGKWRCGRGDRLLVHPSGCAVRSRTRRT